ncbi:hypothetical protein FO519_007509, partial [Halicephalobus sp. NKZ332]
TMSFFAEPKVSTGESDLTKSNQVFINQSAKGQLPILTGREDGEVPRVMGYNTKLIQDISTVHPSEFSGYGVTKFMTPGQKDLESLQSTFSFGNINHQNISSSFNLSKQKTPTPTTASNSRLLQGSANLSLMAQLNAINHQSISSGFQNPTTSSQGIATPLNPYSYIISPVDQPPMIVTNYGIYVSPTPQSTYTDLQKHTPTSTTVPSIPQSALPTPTDTNSELSRPHSTLYYRGLSEDFTPELKDEEIGKELIEDEKREKRRRGNTESQARTREHNATVKELYRRNDKLIEELRNYLFSRGQGISSVEIMEILAFITQNAKGLLPLLTGSEGGEIPRVIGYNTKLMQDASTVNPFDLSGYGVTKFLTPGQRSVDSLQSTFPFGSINHQNISASFNLSKPKTPTSTGTSSSRILQGSAELPWMAQLNVINHQAISNDFQNSTTSSQGIITPLNAAYNFMFTPLGQSSMLLTDYGIRVNPIPESAQLDVEKQNPSKSTTLISTSQSALSNIQSSTSSNTPNDGYESSRPHSTFNYRDVSEDFTPELKDEESGKELTEDEKRRRRKQGNTASQARTREHNTIVKELYRRNDKLIDELRNYLFSRGQGISSADIMKILVSYKNFPEKQRPKRLKTTLR